MAIYLREHARHAIVILEPRDDWIIRPAAEEKVYPIAPCAVPGAGRPPAGDGGLSEWINARRRRPRFGPCPLAPPERRASHPPAGQPPSTAG